MGGDGTPGIAEHALDALAATLGLSHPATLRLVGEAVELCFRLPRLWALVHDGRLQAWKARQVAHTTTRPLPDAVDFVDRHLAVIATRNRILTPGKLNELVHEAMLQCDPDQAAGIEQAALDARGVWFDHRTSTATTDLTARLDTPDALDLQTSLADLAGILARLGDDPPPRPSPRHRPRPARPPPTQPSTSPTARTSPTPGPRHRPTNVDRPDLGRSVQHTGRPTRLNGSRATLFLHITAADLATSGTERHRRHRRPSGCGGRVEQLGPATLDLLRDWIDPHQRVTVRPVLDPTRTDAVDAHDPPGWMRETVILRDAHCVFPGCPIDARSCDLDHLTPYLPPDDGGPPGPDQRQRTSPACADGTTGSRPSPPGPTNASPTATTSGPTRTPAPTASPPDTDPPPSPVRRWSATSPRSTPAIHAAVERGRTHARHPHRRGPPRHPSPLGTPPGRSPRVVSTGSTRRRLEHAVRRSASLRGHPARPTPRAAPSRPRTRPTSGRPR